MFTTLIVEDNTVVRESISALLRNRFPGMLVEEASSSEEALEKACRLTPDLIVMDIKLPGQNGLQLTRSIRSHLAQRTVVVILSGNDLPEYREAAFQNGAEYFLSKSFSSGDELLDVVQSIYSRKDGPMLSR